MADCDLAIIGGGLNGVSLARDAAGRGLRVILFEQGDLAGATSSATPRLIHGDLSALERRGFWRVRRALAERRTWLRIAPHLVRPMRFVIAAHSDERPPWLLRGGDFAWDRFDTAVDLARERWRFLSEPQAQRLVAAYGSRLPAVLGDARTRDDLGPAFGPELTGAEVRHLMSREWARFPDDVLWRRSKLGLPCPRRTAMRWQRSWRM